jgi:hypothetical protein
LTTGYLYLSGLPMVRPDRLIDRIAHALGY